MKTLTVAASTIYEALDEEPFAASSTQLSKRLGLDSEDTWTGLFELALAGLIRPYTSRGTYGIFWYRRDRGKPKGGVWNLFRDKARASAILVNQAKILKALFEAPEGLTINELMDKVDLSDATIRRHLHNLAADEFVLAEPIVSSQKGRPKFVWQFSAAPDWFESALDPEIKVHGHIIELNFEDFPPEPEDVTDYFFLHEEECF